MNLQNIHTADTVVAAVDMLYFNSVCVCVCVQEVIVRDSAAGWDLGPELDHFSSRTRHALQYMNPNKINMDIILDLLAYLGNSE